MILDLFKKKEGEANKQSSSTPNQQAPPATLPPINKPGASLASQPKPAQNIQPQSPTIPPPITPPSAPITNTVTTQPKPVIQPPAQNTQVNTQVNTQSPAILSSASIDPYLPQIVDKVKNEFKDLKNEADKLKEVDFKLTQTTTTVKQFKDFMDDIQKRMEGIEKKAEQFSVALYELTTNEFNPFIAKAPPEGEVKIITPDKTAMIITPRENETNFAQNRIASKDSYSNPSPGLPLNHSLNNGAKETINVQRETINNSREAITGSKEAMGEADIKRLIEDNFKSIAKTMQQPNELKDPAPPIKTSIVQEPTPIVINGPREEIRIHDPLANKTENIVIKKQVREEENKFLDGMKSIPLGQNASFITPPEGKRIREKIVVEDVLNLPPENSTEKEVSERISFEETWNEPNPELLKQEQPTLHKSDIKEMLDKFMQKHKEEKEKQETSEREMRESRLQKESKDQRDFRAEKDTLLKRQDSDSRLFFEDEKKRITAQKLNNPKEYFWFISGHLAKNIPDLVAGIKQLDDNIIKQHFSNEKNDFANWIRYTFKSGVVADALQKCKTKAELIKVLS